MYGEKRVWDPEAAGLGPLTQQRDLGRIIETFILNFNFFIYKREIIIAGLLLGIKDYILSA